MIEAPLIEARVRILFVDDDGLVLSSLKRSLRGYPWDVHFCGDPTKARQMVEELRIDVVVSDQAMPGMSGLELLASLPGDDIVRVMMTGHGDHTLALRAINEGHVFRFIDKPWNDAALKVTLQDAANLALRRRQDAQERRAALTGRGSVRMHRDAAQSLFDLGSPAK
ncbi:MAG: response regulator [Deltaproteobacteria bacterium]|nr:response regulator [Deltaproteobacteria bacterium]